MTVLVTSLRQNQAHHIWLSLGGSVLHEQQTPLSAPNPTVVAVVANGWESPALAIRGADGTTTVDQGGQSLFLDLTGAVDWQLYRAHDGSIHLQRVNAGGPIHHQRISP